VVDHVFLTNNEKGCLRVQIRVRSEKIPEVGDKFASRHGQKGICGMMYSQEDMPFSQNGISPDLIVNPHSIPSRMTIGHLIECLTSKVAALKGKEGSIKPFKPWVIDDVSEELHTNGYQRYGWEVLFSGHTGSPITNMIFLGPIYYQRLKQLVCEKIYCRARGKITSLTRQPKEEKKNNGGLRIGEMERDCIISHGAASFLREKLLLDSDAYRVHVCKCCGLIAVADHDNARYFCLACTNKSKRLSSATSSETNLYPPKIVHIVIPYAAKLLFQELISMLIAPRFQI